MRANSNDLVSQQCSLIKYEFISSSFITASSDLERRGVVGQDDMLCSGDIGPEERQWRCFPIVDYSCFIVLLCTLRDRSSQS